MLPLQLRTALLALLLTFVTTPLIAADVITVPGGWYGERRVDGQYAVLVRGSHVQTSFGNIPLPEGENVLFLRVTPVGPFLMAGQSHGGRGTWFWNGAWSIVGPSFSVSPNIFDYSGNLHSATGSHQGWRYVDTVTGRIWTGDETYADPVRRIGEWSTCGEVTVGQSGWTAAALYQGKRYTIERGSIVNIRLTCVGTALAISYHRQDDGVWIGRTLDASELSTFPLETPDLPPVEVCGDKIDNDGDGLIDEGCPVDPIDPPLPACGEVPAAIQDALRRLAARPDVDRLVRSHDDAERRISAQMFGEQAAFIDPKWGNKNAGGGRPRSKDSIAFVVDGRICNWDIVNGSTREMYFGEGFVLDEGQEFMPVTPTNHLGDKPVDPVDPDPQIEKLKARIVELEAQILEAKTQHDLLQAELVTLRAERDRLRAELDAILARPAPTCVVSGPGWVRSLFGIRCEVR